MEQTLENLSKAEKAKIIDFLKQLKQLKKRCLSLEKESNAKKEDKINLEQQGGNSALKLEEMQNKLIETIEKSKITQNEIEELTLKIQSAETEKNTEQHRLNQAQRDINDIKNDIETINKMHNKEYVEASTNLRIITYDEGSNTYCSSVSLCDVDIQANPNDRPYRSQNIESKEETDISAILTITEDTFIDNNDDNESNQDQEMDYLITMLNAF